MPKLNLDDLAVLKEKVSFTMCGKEYVVKNFSGSALEASAKISENDDLTIEEKLAQQLALFTGEDVSEFMGLDDIRILIAAVDFVTTEIMSVLEKSKSAGKQRR